MRLKTLKPKLATLNTSRGVASLNTSAGTTRMRGSSAVKRRARWLSEHPLCAECLREGRPTAADVVDHVVPLWKGGADDETNFQSLCQTPHHDEKTKREAAERARGY